jgi:hypothetical protein
MAFRIPKFLVLLHVEVKGYVALLQKLPHELRLVGGEIVENDVDLLAGWAQGNDFLQKGNEVLTGTGWLVSSPSSPAATKRCFQPIMVGAVVPNRCLIVLNDAPSATSKLASHGRHIRQAGSGTGQCG